jgi:hypothetical protein
MGEKYRLLANLQLQRRLIFSIFHWPEKKEVYYIPLSIWRGMAFNEEKGA